MISCNPKQQTRVKWQAIVEAQERSGLDVIEYCKAERICCSSFYGRRKQLRRPVDEKSGFLKLLPPAEADTLIPTASYETPVNIRTPNGYQIGLRLLDENGLVKILGMLKSL